MLEREPSRTAFAAATHRAAHQLLEQGRIFADPLAVSILGRDAATLVAEAEAEPARRGMRLFIAMRSRVAEAALADGVEHRGVTQAVVLGAGLDTFAYRSPLAARLRVFEVDHPATQAWKRRRLAEAAIAPPPSLVFAPVDFERDSLMDGLIAAGFDPARRSFFTWLGVVPYLTEPAVEATLAAIAALPGGGEVVFDYSDPPHTFPPELQAGHRLRAERVAALGEPFLSWFEPTDLHARLARLGFATVEDLGPPALLSRCLGPEAVAAHRKRTGAPMSERGGHVLFAATLYGS